MKIAGPSTRATSCRPTTRSTSAARLDDPTIYNRCTDQELCLPEGLCADLLSARISCRKECNSDRGCRDGYECRETGGNGIYVAFSPTNPESLPIEKICMPVEPKAGE
ncbi:hypothetical protein [Nannocystis pusilla]|uniref:hypothetical protein n=1 Tax=Nannocystis pusilla TaxID=889268 RepID=UPI003DA2FA91